MRKRVPFVIAFLLLAGTVMQVSAAQTAPATDLKLDSNQCAKVGYTEIQTYGSMANADNSKNGYLTAAKSGVPNVAISQVSNCASQSVLIKAQVPGSSNCSLGKDCYVQLIVKVTRQCCTDADKQKYSCQGKDPPTLSYTDNEGKPIVISKCDSRAPAAIQKAALPTGQKDATGNDVYSDQPLRDIAYSAPIDSSANTALSNALHDDLGLTTSQANAVADKSPGFAQKMLDAYSRGDRPALEAAADAAGVKLDPKLLDKVALTSKEPVVTNDGTVADNTNTNVGQTPTTFGTDTVPTGTPLKQKTSNEVIQSVTDSVCESYHIQNCDQFKTSMTAVFSQECSMQANCMGHGAGYAGSFALSYGEYNNGIQTFANTCDQSKEACQYVLTSCGGDARLDHVCNAAAATANHAVIERGVQVATQDPYQQAAIHMMYQLMPTQTRSALTSSDPSNIFTMRLGGSCGAYESSIWALCQNSVPLPLGASGGDAIDAIVNRYASLRKGVDVALGNAAPGLGGLVPVESSRFPGSTILARNNMSPFSNSIPFLSTFSDPFQMFAGDTRQREGQQQQLGLGSQQQQQQQGQQQSSQGTTQSIPSVAAIIAQPRQVVKGNPITVSWSSVGMSQSLPCQVVMQPGSTSSTGVLVGQGNEGSKRIDTNTVATGIWNFTVECVPSSAGSSVIRQMTSVSIR